MRFSCHLLSDVYKVRKLLNFVRSFVEGLFVCAGKAVVATYAVRFQPAFTDCELVELEGLRKFIEVLGVTINSSTHFGRIGKYRNVQSCQI